MERWVWKRAAVVVLLASMLAGCGNDGGDAVTDTGQAAAGVRSDGTQLQLPDRTADLMGKVVSVSAESIVLQKSKTQPADMPGGGMGFGGGQRGDRASRQGTEGAPDGDRPQPPEGAPQGDQPQSPADGERPQQPEGGTGEGGMQPPEGGTPDPGSGANRGQRGGGFGGQMEFTDEQMTVKLTADTAIFAMSFGEGGMTNNPVQAADIQIGDILTVWLDSDQGAASTITKTTIPTNIGKAEELQ